MRTPIPDLRVSFTLAIACVAVLAMPAFATAQPPGEWDGLVLQPSSVVDLLYVRPEASLAGYKRVRLEPLQVSFHQDWNPNRTRRGANRLSASDFDNIKSSLANAFATAATAELARGGYDVVTEADEDVLDVAPFVINLIVTAPDRPTAARSRTYAANPGQMTLVAELRDSETGQILMRVIDNQRARSTGPSNGRPVSPTWARHDRSSRVGRLRCAGSSMRPTDADSALAVAA